MEEVYAGIREEGGFFVSIQLLEPVLISQTQIEDYNFGTLMRNNAKSEYTETTTIFGENPQQKSRNMPEF